MKIIMRQEYSSDEINEHYHVFNRTLEVSGEFNWDSDIYAYHQMYIAYLRLIGFSVKPELVNILTKDGI